MVRWFPNKKITVEECNKLEVSFLKEQGFLEKGRLLRTGSIRWSIAGQDIGSIGIRVSLGTEGSSPGHSNFLEVNYTITDPETGEKKNCNYRADLVSTPCRFGGQRWWFICPIVNCDRRVGVLYLPYGGKYFGCRHCYNLTYESVQTHDKRIDYLIRNPWTLKEIFEGEDATKKLLVLRATAELLKRMK